MERPALRGRLVLAGLAALVLAASAGAAGGTVVTATQTLTGLSADAAGGFEPPDVQVAAGPGFVVEMVNLAERTWRTGGGPAQALETEQLATFFASGNDRLTDPRILYDAASGRWFASISDLDTKSIRLAVSSGTDPTAAWKVSSYQTPGCADQPRLGLTDGTVVLAADIFQDCTEGGNEAIGSELWIVNKQELLAGSTSPDFTTHGPDPTIKSLAPAQSLSATSTDYAVSVDEPSSGVVHLFALSGIPPAPVTMTEIATPSLTRLLRPPFASQPPTAAGRPRPEIDTNDDRVLDSVWENGRLWFSANTACTPPGDALIRACGRIVELSTSTGAVSMDENLAKAGAHVFYPTLRPDGSGNLVIVFGESGVSVLPELLVMGRTPDGTFTDPLVVAQSPGPHLGDRYGDYFGAARDPGDPGLVWVAGEVGVDGVGGRTWATRVASVAVTAAGSTPPPVLGVVPPAVRAVHGVARAGTRVRLRYRSLDDGTGVRTVVTVRTKQAVVFNRTTPSSSVHAGTLYSVSWRPAKKLRGTLSYCVQSISSTGTPSQQSCSTVTLR